ncbi:MarR family winged helix-turn-helix transcriptional regulator [Actinomadura parmotrematis]|uniref:MarR family transcriptional regulator n=1 Tax=Actinomadura parmotrematis TaxID=2864039 RepID=A0ABS7G4S9_9ACTN|nr:MarR family transcriptional regulator [Actinomadura parmotrematis]MBW8487693.1 MarR family transcriptional regulator [Actinomadura parmotrematis]
MSAETPEDRFFRELGAAHAALRQAFARHAGLSAQRVRLLVRLHRAGETAHSDLRRVLGADGATVTRLVKELEADGLATRRLDPSDNRHTLAALTPAGARAAADLERRHQAYQEHLLAGVAPDERDAFLGTLARIRANLTAQEPPQ